MLSFTTLFPNADRPQHGVFVRRRLEPMARWCDLTVVAPLNVGRAPASLWRVPRLEPRARFVVHHPRFAVLPGLMKRWDGRLLFWQALSQRWGWMSRGPYDVLDVHYAYPDGVAGQLLALRMGKPFVLSVRGSDLNAVARRPGRQVLVRRVLQQAAAIVAVSESLARVAHELGAAASKIHVVRNGIDSALFFPGDRAEARRRLGWSSSERLVLAVGRLVHGKGFELLLDAVALVRRRLGPGIRCVIVGGGPLRGALERRVSALDLTQHVALAGPVMPDALPDWYRAADVSCLLSESEGCPNVVLESVACGTPVVAADVGGVREIVREGLTGVLVRSRNVEDVAACIEAGLATEWDREGVKEAGAIPDWSDVAKAHLDVLWSAVERA